MEVQVGQIPKGDVQVIGDRAVINPRTRVGILRDVDGNVLDAVRLSMEVCGCGYSFARPGVGYAGPHGWYCKRCGQLHTVDGAKVGGGRVNETALRPDPSLAREFDRRTRVSAEWSTPEDMEVGAISRRKEMRTA